MNLEEATLNLPDGRLHYRRVGEENADKPTLVFLHYFGGSSRTWLPVLAALAPEFPCVAVDLRGSGESRLMDSTADVPAAYALDAMASDVAALVGEVGCRHYVLVGHSMGGKVALALAASPGCPPGLQAVALAAPSPPTPEPMPDTERARLLAAQGLEAGARETLSKITAQPLPAALLRMAVEDQLRVVPAAWRAWLEYGSRLDVSARIERIRVPVFLLAGEQDANITARLLRREIAERLPKDLAREPETVPGAAHLLPLEAPEAVAAFVRRAGGDR